MQNVTASLQGKTFLVTGRASGLGKAVVTAFAKQPNTTAISLQTEIPSDARNWTEHSAKPNEMSSSSK